MLIQKSTKGRYYKVHLSLYLNLQLSDLYCWQDPNQGEHERNRPPDRTTSTAITGQARWSILKPHWATSSGPYIKKIYKTKQQNIDQRSVKSGGRWASNWSLTIKWIWRLFRLFSSSLLNIVIGFPNLYGASWFVLSNESMFHLHHIQLCDAFRDTDKQGNFSIKCLHYRRSCTGSWHINHGGVGASFVSGLCMV